MRIADLKTIPEEVAKHRFIQSGTLERIELRGDAQRRMVSAVFVGADGKTEGRRTLTWEPSKDCLHSSEVRRNVDRKGAESVLEFWASMLDPADAELLRQQLGLVKEVREELEQVGFKDEGAGI